MIRTSNLNTISRRTPIDNLRRSKCPILQPCVKSKHMYIYIYPIIRVCILCTINGKNTRLLHTPELCELASPNWCNHQRSDPHGNQRHFQRELILSLLLLITLNWLVTSHHHQAVTHSFFIHKLVPSH